MSRRSLTQIGLVLAILGVGVASYWTYQSKQAEEENARELARQAEAEERERDLDARWGRIQEESAELIPRLLEGVRLGQSLAEVRAQRPQLGASPIEQQGRVEPGMEMYEEELSNGGRAIFAFERATGRLQRLQMLSLLPSPEAITPHLTAMHDQYGSPTGVWDCPMTGGVPTRRFTWRHGETTVSDVFLVYGGRVSVTLYIAPNAIILRSLRMSGCRPADPAEIGQFPVTTPEQMMGSEPTP